MYHGMIPALVTPFTEELVIDWKSWESLIEWQLESGASGLVIFGTTGESATLDQEEKLELTRRTLAQVNGRVPVIAGAGTNATRDTITFGLVLKELGVDGILTVTPYYNKPTQEGLYQHFRAIADQVGLPVVLYNVPSRTSVSLTIETIDRLVEHPLIVSIKQAVDSTSELLELAGCLDGRATFLAGDDPIVYTVMTLGGHGVISASGGVIPELMNAIVSNAEAGNWSAALTAQLTALPIIKSLFLETNPAPAKAALVHLKRIQTDAVRLPLVRVREATRTRLAEVLEGR